jgi:hypothetical protein
MISTERFNNLPRLNFPVYVFRFSEEEGQTKVFDPARKKYVVLTPEEWVRQHLIVYLNKEKGYPLGLMMVEKEFKYNQLSKRADIVVCDRTGSPLLMVECKSPDVIVSQSVAEQAMRYNLKMKVKTVVLSNGLSHFCFSLNEQTQQYSALAEIPAWVK